MSFLLIRLDRVRVQFGNAEELGWQRPSGIRWQRPPTMAKTIRDGKDHQGWHKRFKKGNNYVKTTKTTSEFGNHEIEYAKEFWDKEVK